jgi:hypothetical protein
MGPAPNLHLIETIPTIVSALTGSASQALQRPPSVRPGGNRVYRIPLAIDLVGITHSML